MNIKNNQKISIKAFNKNNFLKEITTPNIKTFLLKKYISRNNNISPLNTNYLKKSLFTKLRNDKAKPKIFINLTNNINQNNRTNNFINIHESELKKDNEHDFKNKSNENLPNRIINKDYFSLSVNENINEMFNPINRKKYITYNISSNDEPNFQNNNNHLKKKKNVNNFINTSNISNLFTNNSDKTSRNHSLNSSTFSSNVLKHQISKIIKDISKRNKNIEINTYENESRRISIISSKLRIKKNRNAKSIDYLAKRKKNKLLNLLNREGGLNEFLKSMKIKTTQNFFNTRKKPKSSFEMNNLIINSFSQSCRKEFSEQLYTLNENFISAMKKMKKEKAQIENKNFDEKRNSNTSSLSLEIMKEDEKIWEQKFMENMYKTKLSEYEFNNFKHILKLKQKKNIIKHSKNFADKVLSLNLDDYENPNNYSIFKSSGNYISINNIRRIIKMDKLMKDIKDREQFNVIELNIDQLKKYQKKSEEEGVLAIKRAGKPRFVKTKFKQKTINKYKGVSGEFFGLPA